MMMRMRLSSGIASTFEAYKVERALRWWFQTLDLDPRPETGRVLAKELMRLAPGAGHPVIRFVLIRWEDWMVGNSSPKVAKLRKEFPLLLKPQS
jgi:hypothetical protein